MPSIAINRDARRKYHVQETLEAGIALTGHEAKSARTGNVSLRGSFAVLRKEEPYLINAHIGSFQPQNAPKGYDPTRPRKLLLTKDEIRKIIGKRSGEGLTMIPLKLYTHRGRLKVEIGIARSKLKKDRREDIKRRDAEREIRRVLRGK